MLAKILSTEYLQKHQYFTARKDKYQMKSGKIVEEYFVVEMPNSACAVAITEAGLVLLVKQYRHPINKILIELPGGFVEKDEDLEMAIARELLEETGYQFSSFTNLGFTYANPGVLNNGTHLFLATGGVKVSQQMLDDNEEIEILLKPLLEVKDMMKQNEFKQSLHLLCLYKAFEELDNFKKEF